MKAILYEFNGIELEKKQSYIYQLVTNRRLTCVYHSHDFYELILFLNGSGTQLINEKEYESSKDDVILLCPRDRHRFIKQTEDVEVLSLSVNKEEFELFANAFDPVLVNHIEARTAPICFSSPSLHAAVKPKNVTVYDCKLILSAFLRAYIEASDFVKQGSELPPILSAALEKMKSTENLREGISALVRLSSYSQSHLSRLIKAYFGISLKQYINELRLQHAYRNMILTNRNTEDIAESLGFASLSHFNKIFKARFSITPSSLRKNRGAWTV